MKRKRRVPMMGVAFVLLLALAAFFFLRLTRHHPPAVTLPAPEETEQGAEVAVSSEQETLRRVEVTPQTVQLVIERLARPENYRRTVVIERFWNGESGQTTADVSVADGWTRVNHTDMNGETRHSITSAETCWIWYGDSRSVYRGAASLSADEEQSIPTYEDILRLDAADIASADYRSLNGVNCIRVETAPDESAYAERYDIAVDSGLLVSMERTQNSETVYRMTAFTVERDAADAAAFTLPDGTVLHDPQPDNVKSEG